MTYSIVARDPDTGQLGVAVQSHYFSVGTIVSWAEPGVGAVATQSLADPSYGPLGLALMRAGRSAESALSSLVAGDEGRNGRQVCFVDASGGVAIHTGPGCIAEAGHVFGDGFGVQANMMAKQTVWDAMAEAYTSSAGDLVERLLAALEAAETEGGDIRGRQSAAILVVAGSPSGAPWLDRLYDLRVEDHPDPIGEIRRLVTLRRAYDHMDSGDDALGAGDLETALAEYGRAESLTPEIVEMPFWKAVGLLGVGRVEEAKALLGKVFDREPVWRDLLSRVVDAGLLDLEPEVLEDLIAS